MWRKRRRWTAPLVSFMTFYGFSSIELVGYKMLILEWSWINLNDFELNMWLYYWSPAYKMGIHVYAIQESHHKTPNLCAVNGRVNLIAKSTQCLQSRAGRFMGPLTVNFLHFVKGNSSLRKILLLFGIALFRFNLLHFLQSKFIGQWDCLVCLPCIE